MRPDSAQARAVALFLLGILAVCIVRDAWVGDDAYITLRTVKNFVRGYGLVWNAGERVQAYTHPLWMFVLSIGYAITREAFYTTLVTCVAVTFAAVGLTTRIGLARGWLAVPMLVALISSRAFIDYATSGLENPLSHLLLALFFVRYLRYRGTRREFRWLCAIAGLAMLNRMDTILLFAPTIAVLSWKRWAHAQERGLAFKQGLADGLVAFSPFLVWELFSFIYYGSWVPNTALAKLGTGIPKNEVLLQGLAYFAESLQNDHVTLLVVGFGIAAAFVVTRGERSLLVPLSAGIAAYLAYVVWVGGDFMSGRFFTAPFFLSVLLMSRLPQLSGPSGLVVALTLSIVGFASPRATLAFSPPGPVYGRIDERGIADERGFYSPTSGLMQMARKWRAPNSGMRFDGEHLSTAKPNVRYAIGYVGFFAARRAYVVDTWALVDPLLARLPAQRHFLWRVGHYQRVLPEGYIETLDTGDNHFKDEELGLYYEHIRRIVRDPVFSVERLKSLLKLHTGELDHLLDKPKYRYWGAIELDYAIASSDLKRSRTPATAPGVWAMGQSGVVVNMGGARHDLRLEVTTDCDDDYIAIFFNGREEIGRKPFRRAIPRSSGLRRKEMAIPKDVVDQGYTSIRIVPALGAEPFAFGHMRLFDVRPKKKKTKAPALDPGLIVVGTSTGGSSEATSGSGSGTNTAAGTTTAVSSSDTATALDTTGHTEGD